MTPIPSRDTEAGPVLTLPVQLAPEHRQGGQVDGDAGDASDAGNAGNGDGDDDTKW